MRKLMWFTLGFLAACAFCAYFYVQWLFPAACICMVFALVCALTARWFDPMRFGAVVCVGLSIGLCWFGIYDSIFLADARAMDGKTGEITVIVRDYSYETEYGCAADGTVTLGEHTYQVRVYLDDDQQLKPGDRVVGEFSFRYTNHGGARDVLYHRSEGIFLMAYQEGWYVIERCWSTPWRDYPALWRHDLLAIIDECFPEDTTGFAKALLLEDRTGIDYETNTNFKVSGISHIIAVSGLHVSILFGLIFFLAGKQRHLTAIVGIPMVLLFAAVAGFTPSITRAAIMQTLVMVAMVLGKEYDAPISLSFAALVMLVINPLVVSSISFQLSFACMAGIVFMGEPIRQWLLDRKRLGKYNSRLIKGLCISISVSLSATIFTTPLVALHFGTISLVSILTNLLTLWCITYIFYGIMAVCMIGCFHTGIAAFVAGVLSWLIRYVLGAADLMASLPMAAIYTKSMYIVAWLVFAYILLFVYMLIREKPAGLFACLVAVALCLCVTLSWMEPMQDECRMTVLDVGQGQAILLQSKGKTFLVDCGGDYEEEAADIAAETLLSQGIGKLDGIILTHYDLDHSGGIAHLLTRIDTDMILMPDIEDSYGIRRTLTQNYGEKVIILADDTELTYDGVKMWLCAPFSYNSGNEGSICVLFQTENCDILITGDRGTVGEKLLLRAKELPQVDVLVVGHHGSKYSTSEELLEAVEPTWAFISAGAGNRYGHPTQLIIDRLMKFGCVIFRTDENGTIIYRG